MERHPVFTHNLEIVDLDSKIDDQAHLEGLQKYDQTLERAKEVFADYRKTHSWYRAKWESARQTNFAGALNAVLPMWARKRRVQQDKQLIQGLVRQYNQEDTDSSPIFNDVMALVAERDLANINFSAEEISAYRQHSTMGDRGQSIDADGLEGDKQTDYHQAMQTVEDAINQYAHGKLSREKLLETRREFITYFRSNFDQFPEIETVLADNILEIADQAAAYVAQSEDELDEHDPIVSLSGVKTGGKPIDKLKQLTDKHQKVGGAIELATNPLAVEVAVFGMKQVPIVGGMVAGAAKGGYMAHQMLGQTDRDMTYGYQTADAPADKNRQRMMEAIGSKIPASQLSAELSQTIDFIKANATEGISLAEYDDLIDQIANIEARFSAADNGYHSLAFDKGQSQRQHLGLLKQCAEGRLMLAEQGREEDIEAKKSQITNETIADDKAAQRKRRTKVIFKNAGKRALIAGAVSSAVPLASLAMSDAVEDAVVDRADGVVDRLEDFKEPVINRLNGLPYGRIESIPRQAIQHIQPTAAEAADNIERVVDRVQDIEVAQEAHLQEYSTQYDTYEVYGSYDASEFNELGLKTSVSPDGKLLLDTSSMLPDANGDGIIELPTDEPRFAIFQMDDYQMYKVPLDDQGRILIDPSTQPELFQVDPDGHVEFTFNRLGIATENDQGGLTYHASLTNHELVNCTPDLDNLAQPEPTAIEPITTLEPTTEPTRPPIGGQTTTPETTLEPGPTLTPTSPVGPDSGTSITPTNPPIPVETPIQVPTPVEKAADVDLRYLPISNPLVGQRMSSARTIDPNGITPFPESDPNGFTPFEDPNGITPAAELDANGFTPATSPDNGTTPAFSSAEQITPVPTDEITPFPDPATYRAEMAAMRAEMDELKIQLARLTRPSRAIRAENAFTATRKDPKGILENPGYIPEKFMKRAELGATPSNKRGIRNYTYTQARRILGVDANHPDWQAALPKLQSSLDILFNEWDSLDVDTRRRRLRQLANGAVLRSVIQGLPQQSASEASRLARSQTDTRPILEPAEPAPRLPSIEPILPEPVAEVVDNDQPEGSIQPEADVSEPTQPTVQSIIAKTSQNEVNNLLDQTRGMDRDDTESYARMMYGDELDQAEIGVLSDYLIAENIRMAQEVSNRQPAGSQDAEPAAEPVEGDQSEQPDQLDEIDPDLLEESLESALSKVGETELENIINTVRSSDQSQIENYIGYAYDELSDAEVKALTKYVMAQQNRGDDYQAKAA